ncbi:MAG: hypothetical protein ABH840_00385 [Nanoarchaeota archaeon]
MMKKLFNSVFAGAIALGVGAGCVVVERRITRVPNVLRMVIPWSEVDDGNSQPKSLEEIAKYQQACIKPSIEVNFDDWKSAERTHRDGYGDCEDYAISAAYFLEKIGHKPLIMIFPAYEKQSGHAVAVFKKKENGADRFGYIDNGIYGYPIFKSFDDVAEGLGKMHERNWGVKYLWNSHVVLNLNDSGCDWKHGKENLQKYFDKYAKIGKK